MYAVERESDKHPSKYPRIRRSLEVISIGASIDTDFLCGLLTNVLDLLESEDYEEIVLADVAEYLEGVEEEI